MISLFVLIVFEYIVVAYHSNYIHTPKTKLSNAHVLKVWVSILNPTLLLIQPVLSQSLCKPSIVEHSHRKCNKPILNRHAPHLSNVSEDLGAHRSHVSGSLWAPSSRARIAASFAQTTDNASGITGKYYCFGSFTFLHSTKHYSHKSLCKPQSSGQLYRESRKHNAFASYLSDHHFRRSHYSAAPVRTPRRWLKVQQLQTIQLTEVTRKSPMFLCLTS